MKIAIRAHALASLLDQAPPAVTTLSLDCFDTLLWRDVQAPRDVFAGIDLPGGGVEARMWAEGAARRAARTRNRTVEVGIADIYRRLLPGADDAAIAAAVDHELALEARHCFAFAPTVAVMRRARAMGMRVVVVSDTYLNEAQLRTLIAASAGNDVLALIDRVFVSSEHGIGKGAGLFTRVLEALDAAPDTILHFGDNINADQIAPDALGIHTAHLIQFDPEGERRLRLESVAAAMIDPATRVTAPVSQPHRAAVALRRDDDPAWALGHDVLGPIFDGFARWLHAEIAEMAARTGKAVRPLFLMRDGFLPLAMVEAAFGDDTGAAPIEISRFAAACAHLTDRDTLEAFVVDSYDRMGPDVLARQLMLPGHEIARLNKIKSRDPAAAFRRAVMDPALSRQILSRSRGFTDRLLAHLARAGVAAGDAVMLIDLGYNGTVQNLVEPVLRARLGLTVAGRYLLLREEQRTGLDKRGFLDTRHYETRALHALCGSIAVIEQLATVAQGSTTDYAPDGEPIRKAADIKGTQSVIRDRVQMACVAFARRADQGVIRATATADGGARRRAAAAAMARLLFLPSADEVALLAAFDHDVNLGTKQVVKLLDADASAEGLRRRGLSYLNETGRMFIPGELQGHGLPLNLSLFGSMRFALDLRNSDFEVGGIKLPVIMSSATDQAVIDFDARPTADGYYRVAVPVGAGRFTPAVQFGALCDWVQVDSASWHCVADFDANAAVRGIAAAVVTDGMSEQAPGMFQCSPTGFYLAPPPVGSEPMVLSLIFRPLVWRDADCARVAA